MKTKLLKKLRCKAVKGLSIKIQRKDKVIIYKYIYYPRVFDSEKKFIKFMTELWHREACIYLCRHKIMGFRSPYIW